MAVPKRRTSASNRDRRRAHDSLTAPQVISCPQCGEPTQRHRVCPHGSARTPPVLPPAVVARSSPLRLGAALFQSIIDEFRVQRSGFRVAGRGPLNSQPRTLNSPG